MCRKDLDKVMLAALQAKSIEGAPKSKTELSIELSPLY